MAPLGYVASYYAASARRPRSGRRWQARPWRTCASSAAASRAAPPRCIWPSVAFRSCCSRSTASAGAPPDAAARRPSTAWPPARASSSGCSGAAGARTVWDVSVEALALMRELIARYAIDCDWVDGYMLAAVKQRHVRELRAELSELRDTLRLSERALHGSARSCARHSPRDRYAVRCTTQQRPPASAQLHPGTGRRRRARGVQIFEGTRALCFTQWFRARVRDAGRRGPGAPPGALRQRLSGRHRPALTAKIMAVATYIVATEPLGGPGAPAADRATTPPSAT